MLEILYPPANSGNAVRQKGGGTILRSKSGTLVHSVMENRSASVGQAILAVENWYCIFDAELRSHVVPLGKAYVELTQLISPILSVVSISKNLINII